MDTICNKYKTIQCTSGNLYNIVRAFYFVLLYIVQYCFCFVQGHFSHCVNSDAGRMGLGPASGTGQGTAAAAGTVLGLGTCLPFRSKRFYHKASLRRHHHRAPAASRGPPGRKLSR